MDQSSVLISLPQMVDLALNSPEVGAVNFNILHSLLHVLIQQVDLLDCKVEFTGKGSENVQNLLASAKPGPSLNLTEYIVTPGVDQRKVIAKKSRYKRVGKKGSKDEVIIERELKVVDRRRDSKEAPSASPDPMSPLDIEGSATSMHTVVMVEPTDATGEVHVSVALSKVHFESLEDEIQKLKGEIIELRDLPTNMGLIDALRNSSVDKSSPVVDMFQMLTLSKRIDAAEQGIEKLASMFEDVARELQSPPIQTVMRSPSERGRGGSIPDDLLDRLDKLDLRLGTLESQGVGAEGEEGADANSVLCRCIADLEKRLNDYTEQIATLDTMFNNQVGLLQSQFNDLEKEIGEIVERINSGYPGGDNNAMDSNLSDLINKMNAMQSDMETMANVASKLMEEKDERQFTMDAIVEQVELLKTIKANREDLEDALADKADACTVNRKVSHDQFDAACDDLSRGIEDTLVKLTLQEQMWQQALDDIQREIETKLDKMELTPLRDFVHKKLQMLQERLKALASLKKETEAAGTKSKFLRNVNCISCDKDVVMRRQMDPTLLPPPPALPPNKSMAPYLAYELDALRKQQKCMPHSRNLNHFENAMAGSKGGKGDDHICNRYCGGSHTVTTPQQRVARLGHFLQQWGPESTPIKEGQIKGTDGQMYKSRDIAEAKAARFTSEDMDDGDGYMPSMKSRPSMMVHGGILSQRSGFKSVDKKSEADESPPTQVNLPKPEEKRASNQRVSATQDNAAAADVPAKRTSQSSAGRASGARAGSIKKASITPSTGSARKKSGAPPPEEAVPPTESAPPADKADAPAPEAAPAENDETPAENAPPSEEPPPTE